MTIITRGSIRSRMIFYIGMYIALPLMAGLIVLNALVQHYITESKESKDSSLLGQMRDSSDRLLESSNYCIGMLLMNQDVLHELKVINDNEDGYDLYRAKKDLSSNISAVESALLNAIGGKIMFLTDNDYLIGTGNIGKTTIDYKNEEWYRRILENGSKVTYANELGDFFSEGVTSYNIYANQYLYIGRTVKDYSGNRLGIIMVQLNVFYGADNMTDNYYDDPSVSAFMFSNDGMLLTQAVNDESIGADELRTLEQHKSYLLNESMERGSYMDDYYCIADRSDYSECWLVLTVSASVYRNINHIVSGVIVCLVIILVFISIITMIVVSGRISAPLMAVASQIELPDNNMRRISVPRHSYREVYAIVDNYNNLSEQVRELIEHIKADSELKEKTKYELLKAQISPHFLFNTVNAICMLAREGELEKTEQTLSALGDILHEVYRSSNGMTTIGGESALLTSYVNIMKARFGERFRYQNIIPTELFIYEIPSFTMQPIIENAIIHGVKELTSGQIIVSAVEYSEAIMISVFDNGRSVSKEQMEYYLNETSRSQSQYTSIALYNVNKRLKMQYGEAFGLIFDEKRENGFEIWIRIPKRIPQEDC
jgi:two-component system sensor histidine kinase YesM